MQKLGLGKSPPAPTKFAPLAKANLELFDPYSVGLAIGVPLFTTYWQAHGPNQW
jgi:hypothetical protein